MSLKDAAYTILKFEKKPLSIKEIMNLALEKKLVVQRKKSIRSMAVMLYRDTRRGKNSLFMKVAPGRFGLREWDITNEEEEKPYLANSLMELIVDEKETGSNVYYWYQSKRSVIAVYRKDDPYIHHCPLEHFETIYETIVNTFKTRNKVSIPLIMSKLEEHDLTLNRPFRGKSDEYKVRMAIGILEYEGLVQITSTKRPIMFSLGVRIDRLRKWYNDKFGR